MLPGTETNWLDVGNQLQKLNVFNDSIEKSANVLQNKDFNLYSVLKTTDSVTLRNPLASIVATTAIQVNVFKIHNLDCHVLKIKCFKF